MVYHNSESGIQNEIAEVLESASLATLTDCQRDKIETVDGHVQETYASWRILYARFANTMAPVRWSVRQV
ncbi:MAG: hypothetical protein NVSMB52_13030 [Chloroflexota bacterium]